MLKILLMLTQVVASAPQLRPFSTDGCSLSPNGIPKIQEQVWVDCCVEHDKKYWVGGTEEERGQADSQLYSCIYSKGYPNIARYYYAAVRLGGRPNLPTTYRWGYGWNCLRSYGPLTDGEKLQVAKFMSTGLGFSSYKVETVLNPKDFIESGLKACSK